MARMPTLSGGEYGMMMMTMILVEEALDPRSATHR
jgi:hypothetical protein